MSWNIKGLLMIFGIALYVLLLGNGVAWSLNKIVMSEDKYISIAGYVENLSAMRVTGEYRGECAAFRNTFRPEFLFQFAKNSRLFASGYFVKEIDYKMEEGTGIADDFYDQTEFEAYEFHLDVDISPKTFLRAGRQFVIWGETDLFQLLDIINPQDSRWVCPAVMSLEDTRIPMWGINLSRKFGWVNSLELVFFPLLGEEEDRVNKGAPVGGRWRVNDPPAANLFTNLPALGADYGAAAAGGAALDTSKVFYQDIPSDDLSDSRVGMRYRTAILGADVAFMGYYGHDLSPVIQYNGNEIVGANFVPDVALTYHRQAFLGFALNYFDSTYTDSIYRGEFAYLPNKHFNTIDPNVPSGVIKADTLMYCLGWDREFVFPWLHPDDPSTTTFITAQMFQTIVLDHDDNMRVAIYDTNVHEFDTTFTLVMSSAWINGAYGFEVAGSYNPTRYAHGMIRPKFTFKPPWDVNQKVELLYTHFMGQYEYEGMGLFDEKDSIFLRLRYQF